MDWRDNERKILLYFRSGGETGKEDSMCFDCGTVWQFSWFGYREKQLFINEKQCGTGRT